MLVNLNDHRNMINDLCYTYINMHTYLFKTIINHTK